MNHPSRLTRRGTAALERPRGEDFLILRDDLLHPWASGNKLRKLDRLLPRFIEQGVTDILTLGGMQSAHCAAVAALCAERGVRAHVLLRGEPPEVCTGNTLITTMFAASVTWVSRDDYADRDALLARHHARLKRQLTQGSLGIIPEGASTPAALEGYISLINELAARLPDAKEQWELVIDAGTGSSALALALGVAKARLPWRVTGVCLLPNRQQTYNEDVAALLKKWQTSCDEATSHEAHLTWVERPHPRRFGRAYEQDILDCREIATRTGILLDPIYTLAAWRQSCELMKSESRVLMLHTGGALNLFGAAQRWPQWFNSP